MNLFIDTNIFLTFYHLSGEDIEQLKKLIALVEQNKINLLIPDQVCEEFYRNRDAKIKDALKELKKSSFNVSFPAFCKAYGEYDELRNLLKEANKKHSDLVTVVTDHAKANELNADPVIEKLFEKANHFETSMDVFNSALKRYRLGNPPGKSQQTIGDELNWEALLKTVPEKEDLHLVSGDSDYVSPLDEKALHPYLKREWAKKKGSTLHFYTKISDFFKKNYPDIKLASEIEKTVAIENLAKSGSFSYTHVVISNLEKFTDFTPQEVNTLVNIAYSNNQVRWILSDNDVYTFYKKLADKYAQVMEDDLLSFITEELTEGDKLWKEKTGDEIDLDDIPF